jgi:hypothetical protein
MVGFSSWQAQLTHIKKARHVHKNQAVNLRQIPIHVQDGPFFFFIWLLNCSSATARLSLRSPADSFPKSFSVRVLPQNRYTQQLSFSCKKEVQLQRLLSLPVFIRAGSKAYVDYLEKKPNARWQPKWF